MASMFGLPESLLSAAPGEDPVLDVLAKIAKKFGKSMTGTYLYVF